MNAWWYGRQRWSSKKIKDKKQIDQKKYWRDDDKFLWNEGIVKYLGKKQQCIPEKVIQNDLHQNTLNLKDIKKILTSCPSQ